PGHWAPGQRPGPTVPWSWHRPPRRRCGPPDGSEPQRIAVAALAPPGRPCSWRILLEHVTQADVEVLQVGRCRYPGNPGPAGTAGALCCSTGDFPHATVCRAACGPCSGDWWCRGRRQGEGKDRPPACGAGGLLEGPTEPLREVAPGELPHQVPLGR